MKNNKIKVFLTLGASNHSDEIREENDFYATEPKAVDLLLEKEKFTDTIWECAVGQGHIASRLESAGYKVISSDIVDRGYKSTKIINFLKQNEKVNYDIITNPPYKNALKFVEKAIDSVEENRKIAMFLKIQFLEGKARKEFFQKHPPKTIYVSSSRLICAKNGLFDKYKSAVICFAWFVWEKGYKGEPVVKWIN